MSAWRVAAGIAVLLALLGFAILLVPPYVQNWKFQQYLNDLSADAATASRPADAVRADVMNKAAQLGLPLRTDDVRVTRNGDAWKIDALYVVHADFWIYKVDLHFRPST